MSLLRIRAIHYNKYTKSRWNLATSPCWPIFSCATIMLPPSLASCCRWLTKHSSTTIAVQPLFHQIVTAFISHNPLPGCSPPDDADVPHANHFFRELPFLHKRLILFSPPLTHFITSTATTKSCKFQHLGALLLHPRTSFRIILSPAKQCQIAVRRNGLY